MRVLGLLLLVTVGAHAQRGAGNASLGSRTGYGNVVFPGTGGPPRGPATPPPGVSSFAGRLGSTVSGNPGYTGAPAGGGRAVRPVVYLPYAYPVYGGYGNGYGNTEPAPVPVQPSPQVVINQYYTPPAPARPVVREYVTDPADGIRIYESRREPRDEAPAVEQRNYLLAFKDSTIYSAFTYWQEGETLHYVTMQGSHNQVSMTLVDREFTTRLNRERGVAFRLPKPDTN